jgi:hypothetical protein
MLLLSQTVVSLLVIAIAERGVSYCMGAVALWPVSDLRRASAFWSMKYEAKTMLKQGSG